MACRAHRVLRATTALTTTSRVRREALENRASAARLVLWVFRGRRVRTAQMVWTVRRACRALRVPRGVMVPAPALQNCERGNSRRNFNSHTACGDKYGAAWLLIRVYLLCRHGRAGRVAGAPGTARRAWDRRIDGQGRAAG